MKSFRWNLILFAFLLFIFSVATLPIVAAASNIATGVTVVTVPSAPSNLTAIPAATTQVTLSWTDNANGTEDGFSIERKTGVNGVYAVIGETLRGVATYVDNAAAPGTTYFYRVDAFIGSVYSAYSNEASVTTPQPQLPPAGGGIGGGGGGGSSSSYFPAPSSNIEGAANFKGIAYPGSSITLLSNGQVAAVTQAGPDAHFEIDLTNLQPGTYNFGVWVKDPAGNLSNTQVFTITVTNGATTIVSGIFFPPTIAANDFEVKHGNVLTLFGYAAPQAVVTIVVHSAAPIVQTVVSSASGTWIDQLPTGALAYGSHTAVAYAALVGSITQVSTIVSFTIGNTNVPAPKATGCPLKGDLNGDCRVNLIDFSILAYWYGRPNPPSAVLLDGTSVVNLTDFSILAYYWTG